MSNFLLLLALAIAIFDWVIVAKDWRTLEYAAKPTVTFILFLWVILNGGLELPLFWFTLGLLFSLAGDVFLMLPKDLFIPGLVSFLFGQLCYLIGFNIPAPQFNAASLVLLAIVVATGLLIYRRITVGLEALGQKKLKPPVAIYSLAISLMLFSALHTLVRQDWSLLAAFSASAGALLFFISDTLWGWNKFVAPLRYGKIIINGTYHLGQIGIALGAILHFAR